MTLSELDLQHIEACRRHLDVGAEIRTLSGQRRLLSIVDQLFMDSVELEQMMKFAEFVALWANRESPFEAEECLHMIRRHPVAQAMLKREAA